jgi:hypothetical protein
MDMYRFCNDFFVGNVNLGSINCSYITPVPKTSSLESWTHYQNLWSSLVLNRSSSVFWKHSRYLPSVLIYTQKNPIHLVYYVVPVCFCQPWGYFYIASWKPVVASSHTWYERSESFFAAVFQNVAKSISNGFQKKVGKWVLEVAKRHICLVPPTISKL